jgi:hypothetical protein
MSVAQLYVPGSSLEIPGLEATLEYGDASKAVRDRIPGAMLINDHSSLERARITQIDGLHDDPEGADSRQGSADRHGERAGNMLYRGRTIGLTGRAEAGNIGAMRDVWRRLRSQFRTVERDLLVHHPYEVRSHLNLLPNPNLDVTDAIVPTFAWATPPASGGGTGALTANVTEGLIKVGEAYINSATGAGTMRASQASGNWFEGTTFENTPWSGEDVWITARLSPRSTGTITAIGIGLIMFKKLAADGVTYSSTFTASQASISSPTLNSWNLLSARVPASLIDPDTELVGITLTATFSNAGNHGLRFHRTACVLLDPDDPTPSAYFGPEVPGFSSLGVLGRTQSFGPTHAVNQIGDPRFEDFTRNVARDRALNQWTGGVTGTGATVNQVPVRSTRWQGDHVPASLYFKATSGSSGTSVLEVTANGAGSGYLTAIANRRYRFSVALNVISKPDNGSLLATISWRNQAGAQVSSVSSTAIAVGESTASVEAVAPSGAVFAVVTVSVSTTTTSAALELFISDPCFIDVTDWDPGNFYGVGDPVEEVDVYRRIPRPFLLRGVRKTSEMKAPEQQTRSRAWRDFSFSLRASDPRVYAIDRRMRSLKMTGTPQLISVDTAPLVTAGANPSTPPTGFTAEGQSGTTGWRYGTQSMFNGSPMMSVGDAVNAAGAAPVTPVIQRAYRSLEAYTYTNPLITVQGHFQMRWMWGGGLGMIPAFGYDGSGVSYNAFGAIIKRVSSGQWLELRINSSSNSVFGSFHASTPYTVELWCSHNASGAAAVTRLAQWDLLQSSPFPNPINGPATLKCSIDTSNVVNIDITYVESGATVVSMSDSYTLPAPLVTLFGSGVAGHAGEYIRSDNWARANTGGLFKTGWTNITQDCGFPWISYFSVQKLEVEFPAIDCPVIGDVDTPQLIELRGDVENPIIELTSTGEDGETMVGIMRLVGTVDENNPVFIDVGTGRIYDAAGANRYSMLSSGSLHHFQPGHNHLQVSATNWSPYPAQVYASWRDALS